MESADLRNIQLLLIICPLQFDVALFTDHIKFYAYGKFTLDLIMAANNRPLQALSIQEWSLVYTINKRVVITYSNTGWMFLAT